MKKIWIGIAALVIIALVIVLVITQTKREPQEIKIGAILPLTGSSARYGIWIQEALNLYINEINSTGGINGKMVVIIYEDDQTDPKMATLAMQKLVRVDKVPIVFGSWASSCVLAQAPIAEKTKTVIMAQAISPQIRFAGDYVFRDIPDANYSLATLVPFAVKKGVRKAAVIYINNDYGRDQARVFKDELAKYGGKIEFEEGYNSDLTDFRTILSKVKNIQIDAIYLPGYTEVGLILRQMKELGMNIQVYSSDPFENEDILKIASDAAEGVFYPFFFDAQSGGKEVQQFIDKYKQRYGREPEGTAALAYNGIKIILDAIRKAGPNSTEIKNTLYKFKNYQSILGVVNIDSYGDMTLPVYIKTVKNGKFVQVE